MADHRKYLLGLDAGNTVIKAVLFDLEGRQVSAYALDGTSRTPQPGHVERDLSELWENACTVIGRCIQAADIESSDIVAVGCAGHGNGLYLVDKSNEPLVGIQSLDTRAAAVAEDFTGTAANKLHQLCLQKPWPAQTPNLLAWIKSNRPDLYEQAGKLLLCKDFITFRLTGELVSEWSDMSGCGLLQLPELQYSRELAALYGLDDATHLLPRLIEPTEIAGIVTSAAAAETGLAPGTPVIGGFFDVVASALGSGVVNPGQASIIAGSWSINQVFSNQPVRDDNVFMVSAFGRDRFVNIEASATSAANLEWYVRELIERGDHTDDPFDFCNRQVAAVSPRSDDPFFHPFLYGSAQGADFRAGFYGLANWHNEGHLLRALFEGVVFEHRRHIEVLREAGVEFTEATLSGGGSRSPHWPKMFADCLGVPIAVAAAPETGALGAAMGAAIAVGELADFEEATARMTRTVRRYEPDAALADHYQNRYQIYQELSEVLKPIWAKLH